MIQFILAIPGTVLYGCIGLIVFALAVSIVLVWQTWFAGSQISALANAIQAATKGNPALNRDGPPLGTLELIRSRCERLKGLPRGWWNVIDSHVEQYTSTEEVEGWFLTEKPRQILAYEITVSKHFHSALFSAFPTLLTGAGLTLTFTAILIGLKGVHIDQDLAKPITGMNDLINGLSAKFVSSIVALLLSIVFTLGEKIAARKLRNRYEHLIAIISRAIPYLPSSRILLDIQRFAAKQTVSVSHISRRWSIG